MSLKMSRSPRSLAARPDESEYAPYYGRYIALVPGGDIAAILVSQQEEMGRFLKFLSEEQGEYRYAEGKWSVKEVVGHLIDAERVFAFRALAFSRGDTQPYPGMEQDDYARGANYGERSLSDIADEFASVRIATLHLLGGMSDEMLLRRGTASEVVFSVRSIFHIIAGHERHHRAVLREKYHLR